MSWWNPFSTDANNGKSLEELQAESDALDAARRQRNIDAEAALRDAGQDADADRVRADEASWEREHATNLSNEQSAVDSESVFDAGVAGWNDAVAERRKQGDSLISGVLKTAFGIVPRWVWFAVFVVGVIYFWPVIRAFLNRRKSA